MSKLNGVYCSMKTRCYNPNCKSYKNYGGRGITICEEWLNPKKVCFYHGIKTEGWIAFEKQALSHGYKEGLTIDRIDNNKGYSPENCRWVDKKVQANNRNFCRVITYKGKTQNLKQWCEALNLNYKTIYKRIYQDNWSIERAFETKDNPYINMITYKGKTQSIAAWAKELNVNYGTLYSRLYKYNITVEEAFIK